MVQHVHDVRAAHAGRIVQAGVLVAARLEVGDARVGKDLHVLLRAKADRPGRTGLDAGRLLADRNAVGAQGALVGLVVLGVDARHVERTAGDAVAAADAVFLLEIHDAVGVLDDGAGARTGLETTGVVTVHAAVLADQPFELAVFLDLVVPHHRPRFCGQVGRVVVDAGVVADVITQVVPFRTGYLAGLAADAARNVDELGDFGGLADLRCRCRAGGAADNVQRLQCHIVLLMPSRRSRGTS